MSDLNTALRAALTDWNPETELSPTIEKHSRSTSISAHTFNYVRDNPYTTKSEAIVALAKDGCNPASTSAMLAHMVRQRLISSDIKGQLTALVKEYEPLRDAPTKKKHKQVRIVTKPAQTKIDLPEPIVTVEAYVTREAKAAQHIAGLLDNISVKEARELYLELKTMFGGI